jgi:hypothetical protein
MLARHRNLRLLLAVGYLLTVTASALFHHHAHHEGHEEASRPGVSASHLAESHYCAVCEFLAQKPAPATCVAVVEAGELVQSVAATMPVFRVAAIFSAWQSRAPPAVV